jgi:hypothetical protein
MQIVSLLVALVSGLYLAYRAVDVAVRQWRCYGAIPFVDGEIEVSAAGSRRHRAEAMLVGVAVGDALGLPRESLPPVLARLRWGRGPCLSRGLLRGTRRRGAISDDTQLTLAVAAAGAEVVARMLREVHRHPDRLPETEAILPRTHTDDLERWRECMERAARLADGDREAPEALDELGTSAPATGSRPSRGPTGEPSRASGGWWRRRGDFKAES